jgi:hypothetical protein
MLVRKAILKLARLKMFVMKVVFLPVLVNLAQFCDAVCVVSKCFLGFWVDGFCGRIGKELYVNDTVDDVFLLFVVIFKQVLVQSII